MEVKDQKKFFVSIIILFSLTILLYLNSLGNDFIWDDICFIVKNPFINNCSNLLKALNPLYLIEILPVSLSARPVTLISLILDICSGGLSPAHMRFTNILLHAFNSGLLFIFLKMLLKTKPGAITERDAYQKTKNEKIPLIAAILFAFHPIATQVVNIITFRSHLLAVFFLLISLIAERMHVDAVTESTAPQIRKKQNTWLIISLLSFFAALLSNEMAITLPFIWLFSRYIFKEKENFFNKRLLTLFLSFSLIGCFYLWFRAPRIDYSPKTQENISQGTKINKPGILYPDFIFPKNFEQNRKETFSPAWSDIYQKRDVNFFTMMNVFRDYAINLAIPIALSGDYNPHISSNIKDSAISIILFSILILLFIYFLKHDKTAALALGWIGIWLLPASNIIPIINIKADRYLYGALCGYGLFISVISVNLYEHLKTKSYKKTVILILVLYITSLGILTFKRNSSYKNNFIFFNSILQKDPSNTRARLNMVSIFFKENKIALMEKYLKEGIKLSPTNPNLLSKLALVYLLQTRTQKADKVIENALIKNPDYPPALFIKSLALWQDNKSAESIKILNILKKNHPDFKEPQIALKCLTLLKAKTPLNLKETDKGFNPCLFYTTVEFLNKIKLKPDISPILKKLKKNNINKSCQ
jgi:protein O-mannosyl-transferase